jgi:hypothetical protein
MGRKNKKKKKLKEPSPLHWGEGERDNNTLPPIVSFQHLVKSHCITTCSNEEKIAFVNKMYELSRIPWQELVNKYRHGLGSEKIPRTSLMVPVPKHITDEVTFIAFRFDGKKPMVGYRKWDIFYIIWFDTKFNVYPHS